MAWVRPWLAAAKSWAYYLNGKVEKDIRYNERRFTYTYEGPGPYDLIVKDEEFNAEGVAINTRTSRYEYNDYLRLVRFFDPLNNEYRWEYNDILRLFRKTFLQVNGSLRIRSSLPTEMKQPVGDLRRYAHVQDEQQIFSISRPTVYSTLAWAFSSTRGVVL